MGGFLRKSNDEWYGVTCGHVVASNDVVLTPAPAASLRGWWYSPSLVGRAVRDRLSPPSAIGQVVLRDLPPPVVPGSPGPPGLAKNDLAVIALSRRQVRSASATSVSPADGLTMGSWVSIRGAKTRGAFRIARAYPLHMKMIIEVDGAEREFENVFSIEALAYPYVNSVVELGDSGAWVCDHSGNWYGMVFARSRGREFAYASFAEPIHQRAEQAFGSPLEPLI